MRGVGPATRVFTDAERERLKREYVIYRDAGRLGDLAREMGRTVPFLCRQAKGLGLTDYKHSRLYSKWKYMTESAARVLFEQFRRQRKPVIVFCRKRGMDNGVFGRTMRRFFPDEWEAEVENHQPRQSLYRFGRQFEYRVRDHLREQGYVALRSPQSRSPLDLIAVKPGTVLFIQCKRSGALGVPEWNALYHLAISAGAVPLLAETSVRQGQINYWRLLSAKDGTKREQPRGGYLP